MEVDEMKQINKNKLLKIFGGQKWSENKSLFESFFNLFKGI